MPTICMFRGIKIFINWRDHMPPHFPPYMAETRCWSQFKRSK